MKLSAKTEYACLALLELAARYDQGEPVRIRDIADEHGIPSRFLVQILLQLKGAGFVTSTRGAAGGYRLIKRPADISLGEVIAVVEGKQSLPTGSSKATRSPTAQVLKQTWRQLSKSEHDLLSSITFGDLAAQVKHHADSMYYI